MTSIQTIKLDFSIDDQPSALREMIARIEPIGREDRATAWMIDASRSQQLGVVAAAILASLTLESRSRQQTLTIRLPQGPADLRRFCDSCGLTRLCTPALPVVDPIDPGGETVALNHFHNATVMAHDPIVRLIERHVHSSDEFKMVLGVCLSEVMQNVQDHSQSRSGGIIGSRFIPAEGEIRIAVVDRGIGILRSLQPGHPHLRTAQDALVAAIRGNVSAQSRLNNLGLGISNLAGWVRQAGGRVVVATDNLLAQMPPAGNWTFQKSKASFAGTAVFFSLPVT